MIDAAEVERVHAEAERCKYKTGTLGVWARHWLALYEWANEEIRERGETISQRNDEILNASEIAEGSLDG